MTEPPSATPSDAPPTDADLFRPLLRGEAKPAVGFTLEPSDDRPGGSKLGGTPDLPAGFDWPVNTNPDNYHPEATGRPLDFLLQLDLADVAPHAAAADLGDALPTTGRLVFFL